jgi:anti-sigma regulatory factor (Ser/Thr protein kinase)
MSANGFRHEALFYAGETDFLLGTVPFIRHGLELGEAVLVVEGPRKAQLLRRELGEDASSVMFADMLEVGANPARIVPEWQAFVDRHGRDAKGVRGIGEPIWADRSDDELVECQRHEALLNVAFEGGTPWRLLCPYDTAALPASVVDEARRSHPYVIEGRVELPSPQYRGLAQSRAAFMEGPLSPPPASAAAIGFEAGDLGEVRRLVSHVARSAGMDARAITDLVAAANEIATNSLRHGGGSGTLVAWHDRDHVLCEIRDRGRYASALADRERPRATDDPRGLWLANQLCDLVQIRSYATGTVVRLVVARQPRRTNSGWSWPVN